MKVRQQTLGSSLWKAVQMTFVHEGPRAFFKGVLFPALMTGPSNAVFFGIYGNYMRIVQSQGDKEFFRVQKDDPEWMKHVFWGGCTAGFFQVVVTCPPELVKIILQCQTEHKGVWHIPHETHYHGVWDCVRKLFKKRGIPGLYKGVFPMMCRDVPTSGIYTLSYELLKIVNYPIEKLNHPLVKQVMAGGCAGVLSWSIVIPIDVIKSRLQVDSPDLPKYKGFYDCFYQSYRAEGWGAFTKGMGAVCARAFPANAAIFVTYEFLLDFFNTL
ncbi:PREDICTED: solute carrier family 25 member 45 isoform X3 [Nicrophorus vespilloides]|nr:PREDICTED: solute carrier family 25 member 45 isoform X3 [Nicrophorus vespilloides]